MKQKRLVPFLPNGGKPFEAKKIGRNAPCPCGSGKKAKKCCGAETMYKSAARGKALEAPQPLKEVAEQVKERARQEAGHTPSSMRLIRIKE